MCHRFLTILFIPKGKLGVFYLVFYIGLAIGFAICMQGLLAVLNDQYPRYQLSDSIIGTNPGLGFRPFAEQVEKSGFIHFEANNETQTTYWIDRINDFLERECLKILFLVIATLIFEKLQRTTTTHYCQEVAKITSTATSTSVPKIGMYARLI